MADNSILTPGYQDPVISPSVSSDSPVYLLKDNYLSEYETEEEKSIVRENLNIPSKDLVYTKNDVDILISEKIRNAILEYLNMEDPHKLLPVVEEMITNMVKNDGSTPFMLPLEGVSPLLESHLTTKKYVDTLLKDHTSIEDPHNILEKVFNILLSYVKNSEVYNKSQLYTTQEIDNILKLYIKNDGTTPFKSAQVGIDPKIDSHLATKRYVDKAIYGHLVDIDPHQFITTLNSRLSAYIKKKDVYDKTLTYSRTQIDSIINSYINQILESSLQNYMDSVDDKLEYIRTLKYTKLDGSTPFTSQLSGIDATEDNHLTTFRLLKTEIENAKQLLLSQIENKECIWITSGPVESTVGHIEDNTEVPATMTFLEVCDAIFYGKGIDLIVPEYVSILDKCEVTMCIHGSTGLIDYAELYLGESLIYVLTKDLFTDTCISVDSLPISENTLFTFKVYYTNNSTHEISKTVKCSLPVFVGLLPKWKAGNTITMEYLLLLLNEDIEGTLNRFVSYGKDLTLITFKYKFLDASLKHPFIVVPKEYKQLESMITKSLTFGVQAFDIINDIPLLIDGMELDTIYTIYIYRLALSSLNLEIIFNFS